MRFGYPGIQLSSQFRLYLSKRSIQYDHCFRRQSVEECLEQEDEQNDYAERCIAVKVLVRNIFKLL